jgi:hypothetical protein
MTQGWIWKKIPDSIRDSNNYAARYGFAGVE